jgi:hypothetical protein
MIAQASEVTCFGLGFSFLLGAGVLLLPSRFRLVFMPVIQLVTGVLSLVVKWLECEADSSPLASVLVRNVYIYTSPMKFRELCGSLYLLPYITSSEHFIYLKIVTSNSGCVLSGKRVTNLA